MSNSVHTNITAQNWFNAKETRMVLSALNQARFVGGCVRNALLGAPVDDIDIATPLTPGEITDAVERAGLKAVPTGLEHGTVTVICNSKPFEVTTLRRDLSTDGRRAIVGFTADWKEDASRRDFTVNALYADAEGQVFDYFGGQDDLKSGRIRFIGDPDKRIEEDYLRILRYFRMYAWYGRGAFDSDALTACASAKSKIALLSGERIQREMLKLLRAHHPESSVLKMAELSVLGEVLTRPGALDRFSRLCEIDRAESFESDGVMRLISLLGNCDDAREVAQRWRLSNHDRERLYAYFDPELSLAHDMPLPALRKEIYRHGRAAVCDGIRLCWATQGDQSHNQTWRDLLRAALGWQIPQLPIGGGRVMAAGVTAGVEVGAVLKALERWWVENDFPTDDAVLTDRLEMEVRSVLSKHV